ncbi:hypothetical protein BU24DRAFT_466011 [Aaosphaeria arxii CBS 175.79]|uniref:Rhodopsin domain-containing protein n=1 Tax=Aaosphaeria arxii CBS 175.79 TaxID=1450172 RepID=A0A6A5XEE9_9PLEO|nr:uncharacterized protein BU24DRAFT_466011 [Aaosphaeria arxii CBS 175.79]KAF2011280.1 hypothetical protein BU24DRAFT_466011 [Aaosphaeria arxii CBS 175.79]
MSDTEVPVIANPEISPPQVVIVVGWLVVAAMVVAVGTRLATKLSMKRLLGIDDYLIIAATIIGVGQMAVTFMQAQFALRGLEIGDNFEQFEKTYFSSQLLFIPVICISKLSILHSLFQITPVREHKAPIIIFAAFVGMILVAFEFATAFQCFEPRWAVQSGQCIKQTLYWQIFGVFDILTDVFICIFPIYIVSTLQMGLKFKIVVAGVFVTRIAAIAASSCRLVYISRSHVNVEVDAFAFWASVLNTEVEQGLSVITACVPFLKPFFESLETGMMAPSHGLTTMNGAYGSGSGSRSKKSQLSNNSYKLRTNIEHGINVSRRISTHSEDHEGLIKEETTTWIRPVPPHQV